MSYITKNRTEMFKNERNQITLDKDLFAFASNFNDSYFANDMNWKKLSIQFRHSTSNQKKIVVIMAERNDGWFEASTLARTGSWQIDRIQVFDKDGDMDTIYRADMPSPSNFDIETKAKIAPSPLVTGFVENPEAITNGDLSNGLVNWIAISSTTVQNDGQPYAQFSGGTAERGLIKHFSTVPGKRYKYSFRVQSANAVDVIIANGQNYTMTDTEASSLITRLGLTGDTVYSGEFTASSLNTTIGVRNSVEGQVVGFGSLSSQEVCFKLEVAEGDTTDLMEGYELKLWDETAGAFLTEDIYTVKEIIAQPSSQLIVFEDQFFGAYEGKSLRLRFPNYSDASAVQKSMFQYVGNVFQ